ncbi:MAG TPA: hypothetical protein VEA99_13625 [Gemmatimonadaceae bacterium]|nr:hypothetical protein [Gemmatimonadaceae bacterium]
MRSSALLLLVVVLLPAATHAQAAQAPRPSCQAAEHRAFDFWIGEWRVTNPRGAVAGQSSITAILDGCAIREEWRGAGGSNGTSLNFYDRARGAWTQTWIDNTGQPLRLVGGVRAGRMVLEAGSGADLQRITWTPIVRDSVRQRWERSTDGGRSWTVAFDGLYVRR